MDMMIPSLVPPRQKKYTAPAPYPVKNFGRKNGPHWLEIIKAAAESVESAGFQLNPPRPFTTILC